MKKTILLFAVFFIATSYCKADQLAYITKEQAQKATEFLREQNAVILWCACCEGNNPKQIIKISNVYYEHTGYEEYYKVILEGTDSKGNKVKDELDLAYVHFKTGDKAYCVGKTLGYECDPCTSSFIWTE